MRIVIDTKKIKEKIKELFMETKGVRELKKQVAELSGEIGELNGRIDALGGSVAKEKQVLEANKTIEQNGLIHEEMLTEKQKVYLGCSTSQTHQVWSKKEIKTIKQFLKENPMAVKDAVEELKKQFPNRSDDALRCRISILTPKKKSSWKHWSEEENLRLFNLTKRTDFVSSISYFKKFLKEFEGRTADSLRVRASEMILGNIRVKLKSVGVAPTEQKVNGGCISWTEKDDYILKKYIEEHPNFKQKHIAIELQKKEFPQRSLPSVISRVFSITHGMEKKHSGRNRRYVWSDEENIRLWNITQQEDFKASNSFLKKFRKEFQGRSSDSLRIRAREMLSGKLTVKLKHKS